MRGRIHSFSVAKPSAKITKTAIVVNALPLALKNDEKSMIDLTWFSRLSTYFDTTLIPTPMVVLAEKLGIPMGMGKRLTAHQVRLHIKHLTDIDVNMAAVLGSVVHTSKTLKPF